MKLAYSRLQDVRFWKDRLLYQIRRFRQIVGRSLDQGQKAFDEVPDAVERDRWHPMVQMPLKRPL